MRAQAVPLFPSENPDNTWRNEIFEFLNRKLDEIILQNDMKKIEDISGAIFQNKSNILGQLVHGLIKKNHSGLLDQEYYQSKTLSCGNVIDGAFFPQPDFQVPEEKMCQYARENMMMPPHKLAHFVVVHTQLGFGFFKTLFDRPTQAAEPNKGLQSCAPESVANEIAVLRVIADGSSNEQPYGFFGYPLSRQDDSTPGELIHNRTLGAF